MQLVHRLWLNMRRDPSMPDLHHSDIITYALSRLAGQYAREKQEILRDLRNYSLAESSSSPRLGSHETAESVQASRQPSFPPKPPPAS